MGEDLSEAIIDFANALEAACVQLKRYIGERHGVGLKESTFTSLVGWEKSQGERIGEFECTSRKANNNDAFNHAYNILKANDATIRNHLSEKGWQFYYWIWLENPDVIYRKRRTKKGAEPEPKAEAKVDVVENVKVRFPGDLSDLLTFELEGSFVVIKPRKFLGSENFAKIAAIVRENQGEYISAGKESHFRVPIRG